MILLNLYPHFSLYFLRVGVVFCGRQSPGGHNVIWGLYEAIKIHNPKSTLLGFLGKALNPFDHGTAMFSIPDILSFVYLGDRPLAINSAWFLFHVIAVVKTLFVCSEVDCYFFFLLLLDIFYMHIWSQNLIPFFYILA